MQLFLIYLFYLYIYLFIFCVCACVTGMWNRHILPFLKSVSLRKRRRKVMISRPIRNVRYFALGCGKKKEKKKLEWVGRLTKLNKLN